jgi:hypothetical protein
VVLGACDIFWAEHLATGRKELTFIFLGEPPVSECALFLGEELR